MEPEIPEATMIYVKIDMFPLLEEAFLWGPVVTSKSDKILFLPSPSKLN